MTRPIEQRLKKGYALLALSDDSINSSEDLMSLEEADRDYAHAQGMHEEPSPDVPIGLFYHNVNSESVLGCVLPDSKEIPGRKGGLTYIGKPVGFREVHAHRKYSEQETPNLENLFISVGQFNDYESYAEPIISQNRRRGRYNPIPQKLLKRIKKEQTFHGQRIPKLFHQKNKFYKH